MSRIEEVLKRASREGVTMGRSSAPRVEPAVDVSDPLADADAWVLDTFAEADPVPEITLTPEATVAEPVPVDPAPELVTGPIVAPDAPPATTPASGFPEEQAPVSTAPAEAADLPLTPPVDVAQDLPLARAVQPTVVNPGAAQRTPPQPRGVELLVTRTQRLDAVEQYRKLAASLHEARQDRNLHSVLCTSALMGEGKTVTACNLALTLAESYGRRVLLIDADLRRPAVHTMFDLPNTEGLSDALSGRTERKLAVQPVTECLSVVTAGTPLADPMKGLTSERLRAVIEQATAKYDWVIVDTPPVLLLPDARVLVSMVDSVVMVVRAHDTPFRTVVRAIDVVRRDRVFGVVLNSAEQETFESYYGGYQGYYASPSQPA